MNVPEPHSTLTLSGTASVSKVKAAALSIPLVYSQTFSGSKNG
jgi:hypothetical protein